MIDFDLTEEQKMLQSSARAFLESNYSAKTAKEIIADLRGYCPDLWSKMAGLGWMGVSLPEKYGGAGGTFLDLCVLCEEMGRACFVGPFFPTAVVGAPLILEAGNEEQKQRLLTDVVSGKLILTLALTELSPCYDPYDIQTEAKPAASAYVIDGTKVFVEYANIANCVIAVARTKNGADKDAGLSLFLVDSKVPGISVTVLKTIAADKQCEVVLRNVRVSKDNLLGKLNEGGSYLKKALDMAAVAKCAEMVGNAQKVLEMSVTYAKERVQFGRPIGSNQAIQWLLADMAIEVNGAKHLLYKTAWELSQGLSCSFDVAACKAWVSDAQYRICIRAHEVFGAIGFTEDHDLPLYSRRAKVQELAFGDGRYHRSVVAQELGL
jgi:alkylation response protein AidB-like acyl-CoA dehydrogenase